MFIGYAYMINFRFAIFIIFTISLFLVTFFASAQRNPGRLLKNTSWVQQGYDRCLRIDDSTYTYYNVNSVSCKVLTEGKLSGRFKVVSLNKGVLVLNPGGIVNYVFRKVDSLPPVCVNSSTSTGSGSYEDNFKVFWETFDRNYAFFKERNVDWKHVYEEYFPRVGRISSQKEFADILVEIIKKIGDGHIRLEIPDSLRTKLVTATPTINRTKDGISHWLHLNTRLLRLQVLRLPVFSRRYYGRNFPMDGSLVYPMKFMLIQTGEVMRGWVFLLMLK